MQICRRYTPTHRWKDKALLRSNLSSQRCHDEGACLSIQSPAPTDNTSGGDRTFLTACFPCCGRLRQNLPGNCSMAYTVPINILGLQVSGDLGDLTIYTDRFGKKVAFPKTPPDKPPTSQQNHQRARFFLAQEEWFTQTEQVKKDLEDMCRLGNVPMTGQNLWISVALRGDFAAYKTLQNQTGITVPNPTRRI